MKPIEIRITEPTLRERCTASLGEGKIPQEVLYAGEGAMRYMAPREGKHPYITDFITADHYVEVLQELLPADEPYTFISIGCGTARMERDIFSKLKVHPDSLLILNDISLAMIEMARDNMAGVPIRQQFICDDVFSSEYCHYLGRISPKGRKQVFFSIVSLIGNSTQFEAINKLYNLARPGDLLLFDAVTRPNKDDLNQDYDIFERYKYYCEAESIVKFHFGPLADMGVDREAGVFGVHSVYEEPIGSLVLQFTFTFTADLAITYNELVYQFKAGQEIILASIRVYQPHQLQAYFARHSFVPAKVMRKPEKALFVFERR